MKNKTYAIVVLSFDDYSDLWIDFFSLFEKFWSNNKESIYLVTNEKDFVYKNLNIIKTGKEIDWFTRTKKALEMIKEDTIILFLEDYFISDYVNEQDIDEILKYMYENNVLYYRLINIPKLKPNINSFRGYIKKNEQYGVNLQCAIWDKKYLFSILNSMPEGKTAWDFEVIINNKINKEDSTLNRSHVFDARNIFQIKNGVFKGKWIRKTIRFYKRKGYNLHLGNRQIMSIKETIYYFVKRNTKKLIPKSLRPITKSILKKFGINFLS